MPQNHFKIEEAETSEPQTDRFPNPLYRLGIYTYISHVWEYVYNLCGWFAICGTYNWKLWSFQRPHLPYAFSKRPQVSVSKPSSGGKGCDKSSTSLCKLIPDQLQDFFRKFCALFQCGMLNSWEWSIPPLGFGSTFTKKPPQCPDLGLGGHWSTFSLPWLSHRPRHMLIWLMWKQKIKMEKKQGAEREIQEKKLRKKSPQDTPAKYI